MDRCATLYFVSGVAAASVIWTKPANCAGWLALAFLVVTVVTWLLGERAADCIITEHDHTEACRQHLVDAAMVRAEFAGIDAKVMQQIEGLEEPEDKP